MQNTSYFKCCILNKKNASKNFTFKPKQISRNGLREINMTESYYLRTPVCHVETPPWCYANKEKHHGWLWCYATSGITSWFCTHDVFPHTVMFSNFPPTVLQWENDCMINIHNYSHINSHAYVNIQSCSWLLPLYIY